MNFKFYLLVGLILSLQATSAEHLVQKNSNDHGPNIPTIGSSLFDKIYSKTTLDGKTIYDIKNELRGIVDTNGMKKDFIHTFFPFSRSLQRPQDLSYDPVLNPRIVFAPRGDNQSIARGKLFLGYVEAKDQVEVISYNDEAGRFEFQLIANFTTKPEVFYVNRGKCLTCHQGLAPIFSTPGWTDTSIGRMGQLTDVALELKGSSRKKLIKRILDVGMNQEQIAVFDSLVRESNKITRDERSWVHGCGKDNRCRLGLLLNTLARTSSLSNEYVAHAKEVVNSSELKKQKYFHSFLAPFDLKINKMIQEYGSIESVVTSDKALLEIINNLYNLSDANNPATKRMRPLGVKDLTTPLDSFLLSDKEIISSEIDNVNITAKILIDLYKNNHEIFKQSAINKINIMATLLKEAGSKKSAMYSHWINKKTPEKILFQGHIQPIFRKKELNLFSQYCHSCHAIGLSFPPQFLLGTEEEVVSKITGLKDRIIHKLENNLMPPSQNTREQLKKSGDYKTVMKYLKSL